jgi:hypothetical protein
MEKAISAWIFPISDHDYAVSGNSLDALHTFKQASEIKIASLREYALQLSGRND